MIKNNFLKNLVRNIYQKLYFLQVSWRGLYYSLLFQKFGKSSVVFGRITVFFPENISLGNNCTLNEGNLLNAREEIIIGDFVHISPGVIISTGGLNFHQPAKSREHFGKPISISDGVWVGAGAIILPGVSIGKDAVVAAGAVVTASVPANSVVAGVPAKIIKSS